VLAGGVGAARFLRGLSSLIDPTSLTVIVNTGDDEVFHGLHVSPDVDTVLYTLAGLVATKQGWGVNGDTFACIDSLARYYDETWFRLGDRDLATHILRTDLLRRGANLSTVTKRIRTALGIVSNILPMSDDRVRTFVDVEGQGALPFQQYLVRDRGLGVVRGIRLRGLRQARPTPGVLGAIRGARVLILPPSNPFVSIEPILGIRDVRTAVRHAAARCIAISPIIGDAPVKGPLDRMLRGLGHEVSPVGVARLYRGIASAFVLDRRDAALAPRIAELGMRPVITDTLMSSPAKSRRLAAAVLAAVD